MSVAVFSDCCREEAYGQREKQISFACNLLGAGDAFKELQSKEEICQSLHKAIFEDVFRSNFCRA